MIPSIPDEIEMTSSTDLLPFLKWAGGKQKLLSKLVEHFPERYDRYVEPFVGGGAVLFHLKPRKAIINDINQHLITTYRQIKLNIGDVISVLEQCENNDAYYYGIRGFFNDGVFHSDAQEAALFIYLNKTCYRGLYRENSKGKMNTPYGNYKKIDYDFGNLRAISRYFNENDIDIRCGDYQNVLTDCQEGDFVYLDPPYFSSKGGFTKYSKEDFLLENQIALRDTLFNLTRKGVHLVLSNSPEPQIMELYAGFRQNLFYTPRNIRSAAEESREPNELVVTFLR